MSEITSTPNRGGMNPYGITYVGTTCSGTNHNHELPADATEILPTLSHSMSTEPVRTVKARDGRMYRSFGRINYWPASGSMHITERSGATTIEHYSLLATAEAPRLDPGTWPAHPCHPERRRITLYRPVDEHYIAEVEAATLENLELSSLVNSLASKAEGLANV